MAKKLGLPQTKGQYKLRGLVTGIQREDAFKTITTKSKKGMNILKFGVETAPDSTVYVQLQGVEKDEVYFSKRSEVKGQKSEVKKVKWSDRAKDQGEGFGIIGIGVGLEQDEKGKNIVKSYAEFDAAEKVYESIEDGQPVFIIGEIEFSHFKNDRTDEVIRNRKFNVGKIYNSKAVDFEAEDFEESADFKQRILFVGIEKADDKNDPHFKLEAKIVTYNSVEDAEFIIRNSSLANQFRKSLKPYNAIDVWGKIFNKVDAEEEQTSSGVWGEEDNFKRINKSYIRELVITGADPETLDTETYTEEIVDEALKKMNSQGQVESAKNSDWGESEVKDISDDDLPW